ncbi:threonine/serine dehydratase [Actinospica durhamensis]|uniref:Threonine/serine dehydratase n=1 Tax=Actinospica durhamensis TaxID=1508375 RepID=A0A941IPH0_9ACTN|nr:threonine/serine dehydratase [Actinospica durhamensis]
MGPADVAAAAERIAGRVRPVALAPADPGAACGDARVTFALEYLQHTGSFKARGAANLAAAHQRAGTLPPAGVVIASGGNAGLACAWAARATGTRATVFLPETAPAFKVAKLRGYGADVRQVGTEYAEAYAASRAYADESGAFLSHAYDNPLIAAGAGTLATEILAGAPGPVHSIVVAVGGGGLFAGVAAALAGTGIRAVAVEPEHCRALNAALAAGGPVDVPVESVAADALGARRVSQMAYELAQGEHVRSVLVTDAAIVEARRSLWEECRIAVEHGGAAAWAAVRSGAYKPRDGEHVVVVLCGANTDPADLVAR